MLKRFLILFLWILPFVSIAAIPPKNVNVNIASVGATDRTQFASLVVSSCTIQANAANTGNIYVGGSTVTNASGANPGVVLTPGSAISNINVSNSNMIFVAADTSGDDVTYVCN